MLTMVAPLHPAGIFCSERYPVDRWGGRYSRLAGASDPRAAEGLPTLHIDIIA